MIQSNNNVLAVRFTCANTIEQGDAVEISATSTVAVPAAAGSYNIIGSVDSYVYEATECVVATKFRQRRDDRTAGDDWTDDVGAFVWGNNGKVYKFVPSGEGAHNAAAIAGVVIKGAAADGTVETLEY